MWLGSLWIAMWAHVQVPLPWTPVPLILQNNIILLSASCMSPQMAVGMVGLFLAQGALGLPCFAGGAAGYLRFLGPTGGYLIGFLVGAWVVAYLCQNRQLSWLQRVSMMMVGLFVIYLLGVCHLSLFLGLSQAWKLGVAPFLVPDIMKNGLLAYLGPKVVSLLNTRQQ
jgi:biotin transport system substrate-specific component